MTPVKSSNIAAIGHDAETGKLHVQFKSGGTWVYDDVPAETHAAMTNADSVGSYFHKNIKGKFEGKRRDG